MDLEKRKQLSDWYAKAFDLDSEIDWTQDTYRINLDGFDRQSKVKLMQGIFSSVGDAVYAQQKIAPNDPEVSYLFYFHTLTVPNTVILENLYAVHSEDL